MAHGFLTVKQLASELGISVKFVQRAYRRKEIPVHWVCRMALFNLEEVRRAMAKNGEARMDRMAGERLRRRATAGASRRRAEGTRPRSVKRGRSSQERTLSMEWYA